MAEAAPNPARSRLRVRIIDAAANAFAERGIRGTTMDGIAASVGVSKPTVYAHFANKAALVAEVVNEARRRQEAIEWPPFRPDHDVEEQIMTVLDRHIAHILSDENLHLYRTLVIEHGVALGPGAHTSAAWMSDDRPRRLRRLLRQLIEPQTPGDDLAHERNLEQTTELLCALVDGQLLWPVIAGIRKPLAPRSRQAKLRSAIRFFLHAALAA